MCAEDCILDTETGYENLSSTTKGDSLLFVIIGGSRVHIYLASAVHQLHAVPIARKEY